VSARVNGLPGFTEHSAHYLVALSVIDNYTASCACVRVGERRNASRIKLPIITQARNDSGSG